MVSFFSRQSGAVKVFLATVTLTVLFLFGSSIYYDQVNQLEDPRLQHARLLQQQYDDAMYNNEFGTALSLLDSWQKEYEKTPGYQDSFELGVIANNRGSVYLIQFETDVLTNTQEDFTPPYHYLAEAEQHMAHAIERYEAWLAEFGTLSTEQLKALVAPTFPPDDSQFADYEIEKLITRRVDKLKLAQIETVRRLSVSLTNLGVIRRYQDKLEESKRLYEKAIKLWDRNYTAQDNLDMLLGKTPQKRSLIDKLFPPEKEENS